VVRQLEVDSALGRWQREHADVLDGRDLVDFGDQLDRFCPIGWIAQKANATVQRIHRFL
jgi:hypothetical protein